MIHEAYKKFLVLWIWGFSPNGHMQYVHLEFNPSFKEFFTLFSRIFRRIFFKVVMICFVYHRILQCFHKKFILLDVLVFDKWYMLIKEVQTLFNLQFITMDMGILCLEIKKCLSYCKLC